MSKFIESADSRETSIEIMEAIFKIARDEQDAERIWEAPESGEVVAIQEIVTGNGIYDATDFFWGAAGEKWAE